MNETKKSIVTTLENLEKKLIAFENFLTNSSSFKSTLHSLTACIEAIKSLTAYLSPPKTNIGIVTKHAIDLIKDLNILLEDLNAHSTSTNKLDLIHTITNSINELEKYIEETRPQQPRLGLGANFISKRNELTEELTKEINFLQNKISSYKAEFEEKTLELNKQLSIIEKRNNTLQDEILEKSTQAEELYNNTLNKLNTKEDEVDALVGRISGNTLAGSYEGNAIEEKKMADRLRYASLSCMTLIIIIVGYAFWETTAGDFIWEKSAFRIILAALLSIPAAYLARESTKHREQQYNHLQTSLDLKSINPYLASLPDEQQHQIKMEIASRIFAARNSAIHHHESYPINTHELLMEIIKKLEFKPNRETEK